MAADEFPLGEMLHLDDAVYFGKWCHSAQQHRKGAYG